VVQGLPRTHPEITRAIGLYDSRLFSGGFAISHQKKRTEDQVHHTKAVITHGFSVFSDRAKA
jgi:hypothetical protein